MTTMTRESSLEAALREAIALRVSLYRHSDMLDEDAHLTDEQVARKDKYASKWLAALSLPAEEASGQSEGVDDDVRAAIEYVESAYNLNANYRGSEKIAAKLGRVLNGLRALSRPSAESADAGDALTVFDSAIAAELPRVSHVEYDSHEICKHFAAKVRERIDQAIKAEGENK